jgi:hypothetical protein
VRRLAANEVTSTWRNLQCHEPQKPALERVQALRRGIDVDPSPRVNKGPAKAINKVTRSCSNKGLAKARERVLFIGTPSVTLALGAFTATTGL